MNVQTVDADRAVDARAGDAAAAGFLAAGPALVIYLSTMFPGLAGIGDTPKWQFIGSVLGTPHSPGYPLYVLVSWVFAHIPIGTLAFRINLLSVVAGAVAVGLIAAALVELGCRPVIAAAGALAVGLGRVFWSQALLAEVYTLNAALFAGSLFYLVRWRRTRRDGDLLLAGLFVALGGAHHPTSVMAFPALAAYALAVDARRVLRTKIVLQLLAIAVAAASLYLLLWLRTVQHAALIEVHPQSFGELLAVMRGQQFEDAVAPYTVRQLVYGRVPLISGWMAGELRRAGLVLAGIGAVTIAARRWREAVLLLGAAACVLAFAVDYDAYDIQVFLIIPMIVFGMLAALGFEQLARLVSRLLPRPAHLVPVIVAIAAVTLVAGQFRANIHENNQHAHRFEAQYFGALFAQLPARAAIVEENYTVDHIVQYEMLGEHAAKGRDIQLIRANASDVQRYLRDGFTVYAFENGRQRLARQGVFMDNAPLSLPVTKQPRHLMDTEILTTIAAPLGWLQARTQIPNPEPPAPSLQPRASSPEPPASITVYRQPSPRSTGPARSAREWRVRRS